jgi:macrolide transport system ATP-binding/permease protein
MKPIALEMKGVHFAYKVGDHHVPALNGISFQVREGEMVAIQGPSGSGKSTLLYLLGCMLKPDRGLIRIAGEDVLRLNDVELAYFRNRQIGFVFQQFHLLPSTDVLSNILLPTQYPLEDQRTEGEDARDRACRLASRLGLGERLKHKTQQLSGGQQQRVAIARALIRDAPLILADEPTGNLDSKTSAETLRLLRELNQSGKTIIIITHDPEVASKCDRVIWVKDGRVQSFDKETPADPDTRSERASVVWPKFSALRLDTLIRESLPRAWENVRRHRTRSWLTMLGVVVGVASILAMLTLGTFIKEKILESYATMGINTLLFSARPNWAMKASDRPPNTFYALSLERDVEPLPKIFPEIKRLSPLYSSYNHSVIYGGRSVENEASVIGVNDKAFAISRRALAVGSGIQPYHVERQSSVCVIGFELAQRLFQRESPLGKAIQVAVDEATFSCVVVGVSKRVTQKDGRFKADLQVVIPYTSFLSLPFYHYYRQLRQLMIEVDERSDVEMAGKKLQAFFEQRYGKSGTFQAASDSVLIAQMKRFLNLFTLLLVSIAALSLVVGGMGITNMMLVSVNERFREIGLRKAMGASHSAIRQLFFAESLFLCLLAGLIGLAVGFAGYQTLIYIGAQLIPDFKFQWVLNPLAVILSFVAILVTGLLSGLGPAIRAEKLQVIEALRSE